mgnify:CR=1 FL=1
MTLSVLINASAVYTGKELLKDAYVYIEDGVIREIGPQPAPDEVQSATLLLGGEGRVVVPGLAALADVAAYPIRFSRPNISRRLVFYRGLSERELFTASLPGVYELHVMGVTTIFVESLSPSLPVELARRIGGFYGAARPSCSEPYAVQPILRGSLTIGGEGCPGGDVTEGEEEALVLTGRAGYQLDGIGDVLEKSQRLRRMAGLPEVRVEPNQVAELVVYDTSRPPAMMMYVAGPDDIRGIYGSHASVESVIAGMDILVEMGEHMRIGRKHLSEALQLYRRLKTA